MERFPVLLEPCIQQGKRQKQKKEKRTSGRREKRRSRWIVVHAARHMSKMVRDTLPGLCQGGLEALFCHPAQEIEARTNNINSYHVLVQRQTRCKVHWTGQEERLPGVGKMRDGRMAERGVALGAKTLKWMKSNQMPQTPHLTCVLCLRCMGLCSLSRPLIGGRRAVPVTSHLRWTHAHVRCAARSQITQASSNRLRRLAISANDSIFLVLAVVVLLSKSRWATEDFSNSPECGHRGRSWRMLVRVAWALWARGPVGSGPSGASDGEKGTFCKMKPFTIFSLEENSTTMPSIFCSAGCYCYCNVGLLLWLTSTQESSTTLTRWPVPYSPTPFRTN
jgi:hypothetical protein